MGSIYFREQKHYTQDSIIELLGCDGSTDKSDSAISAIRRLKEYGVLKAIKKSDDSDRITDLSNLQNDEIELCEVDANDGERNYVFDFVGVIVVGNFVLRCYPKYLLGKDETENVPKGEMRQVIAVIERYGRKKEQNLRMLSDVSDLSKDKTNILDLYLFFIWDYNENGLYGNYINAVEKDGLGEIKWDKTVNEIDPIFSNGRPIYPEFYTRMRVEDDNDYIRRLHKYVLTWVTGWLNDNDLLDLFGLTGVCFDDADEENFKDKEYILYRLDCELNRQFNSRKQLLLKAMRIFFSDDKKFTYADCISSFGTTSFNLVWEGVLRDIFDRNGETQKHVRMIKKPHWVNGGDVSDTFIPDIVYVYERNFLILDAKYYVPDLSRNPTKGMPGIESISKQYLYQMALLEVKDIEMQGRIVENYFLFPTEKDEVSGSGDRGDVQLDILTKYDSSDMPTNDIKVRFLPAKTVFDCYLNGREFTIDELKLNDEKAEERQMA